MQARAAREVIVCGGAVNSPQLLQLSGIGPAAHLQSIGVPVVHDLPGVGSNLIDHLAALLAYRVRGEISVNQLRRGARLMREVARWCLFGTGALTFGVSTASVFARMREGRISPDLQILFTPGSYDRSRFGELEREPGMTAAVCAVNPESRGTIMAVSPDPKRHAGDPAELFLRARGYGGDAGGHPAGAPHLRAAGNRRRGRGRNRAGRSRRRTMRR